MTSSFQSRLVSAFQAERSSFDANESKGGLTPHAFPRTGSLLNALDDIKGFPLLVQRPAYGGRDMI